MYFCVSDVEPSRYAFRLAGVRVPRDACGDLEDEGPSEAPYTTVTARAVFGRRRGIPERVA